MRDCHITLSITIEPVDGPSTIITIPRTWVADWKIRSTIRKVTRQMTQAAK